MRARVHLSVLCFLLCRCMQAPITDACLPGVLLILHDAGKILEKIKIKNKNKKQKQKQKQKIKIKTKTKTKHFIYLLHKYLKNTL